MRFVLAFAFTLGLGLGGCKGDLQKCDQACRNFATLVSWKKIDAEISAAPADQRSLIRHKKLSEFTNDLETGVDSCVSQCQSANNEEQIGCMIGAKTADQASACVAEDD